MKVKVSTVHGPGGMLYPRDTYTVVRSEVHQTLVETETGARQWVGNSFLLNTDRTPYIATHNTAASSEVTEEQLQRALKAWFENPFRKTSEAMRAALTSALQGDRP